MDPLTPSSPKPRRLGRGFALGLALLAGAASAQRFSIPDQTVDGGGQHSQGTRFAVEGTVGQPDAAPPLIGNRFTVTGGFWQPVSTRTPPGDPTIFSNGFEGTP